MSAIPPVASTLIPLLQVDLRQRLCGETDLLVQYAKALHNPYSDVYVYDVVGAAAPQRLYVKVPHRGGEDDSRALRRLESEFDILQRLQGSCTANSEDARFGTVIPLNLYPQIPALATFEASPGTLREHYQRSLRHRWRRCSIGELTQEITHCGLWLRGFQNETAAGSGAFDVQALLDYVEIRLRALVEDTTVDFSQQLADLIRQRLTSIGRRITAASHKICGRHNDFASHNILVQNGRVWVIDFSMYDTGSSAFDPAYFWMDLELLKYDPSYSKSVITLLQDRFLHAYGGIRPEDAAFQLVRCQYLLNRILTLHTSSRWPTPANLYRRAVVKSSLAWLQGFGVAR